MIWAQVERATPCRNDPECSVEASSLLALLALKLLSIGLAHPNGVLLVLEGKLLLNDLG